MTKPAPLIVAVGASAGGLEAFTELLSGIGDDPGFAIVLVQHLDPNNKSLLGDLLRNQTSLAIEEIATHEKIKPNTVYLCPPRGRLNVRDGVLVVSKQSGSDSESNVIDHFFHDVAETQGQRGIGIILSGSGSDGTLGLKSISDAGGMTFAQDSESAKFDSMPRNAATTGVADQVMPPEKIAAELLTYARYLGGLAEAPAKKKFDEQIKNAIPQIADSLLAETGHNFKHYKTSTLARRIQRRMQILKLGDVDAYVTLLQDDKNESQHLFRELLISVTAFFRDPESFDRLAKEVIPKLFENRQADGPVRIWVPGCATGEEAYTIAMLCYEHVAEVVETFEASDPKLLASAATPAFQIFASDIDERALSIARSGIYPAGIADHVCAERLKRFFVKKGKRYHVKKEIRETILFSSHNLISDPPFSRQDMISCRNLLIYLGPHLQKKLFPLFHFALRPSGYLFLGPSESIATHGDLFRPVDQRHRISQRKGTTIGRSATLSLRTPGGGIARVAEVSPIDDDKSDVVQIMQRIILDEFAPKSVVIDEEGQVICSSAETNKYLSIGDGAFQNNILKMAQRGLRIGLRATLGEAKTKRRRIVHENLSVQTDDGKQRVMITVQPMMRLGEDSGLFIVVFHDVGLPMGLSKNSDAPLDSNDVLIARGSIDRQAEAMVEQLERELATTRDDLDKTMQEMETANEELKSSNEELLSMNEELQSANEELETSKEEIRASSEAVGRANADLENLLRSTRIATIFLDDDLCIRSFTPAATDIYGLITTDTGRPLGQIVPNVIDMPPLPERAVLETDPMIEHTVAGHNGRTYIRRVMPYQTSPSEINGMVVTFTDVTELEASRRQLRTFTDAIPPLLAIVDTDERFTFVNQAYADHWNQPFDQIVGKMIQDIVSAEAYQAIHPRMQQAIAGQRVHFELELKRPETGASMYEEVVYVPQTRTDGTVEAVHVVVTDLTELKTAQKNLLHNQSQLNIALRAGRLGAWSWDVVTGGLSWSPQLFDIFGCDADNFDSKQESFFAVIHPDDRDRIREEINASFAKQNRNHDIEFRVVRPSDGRVIWSRGLGVIDYDDDGRPLRVTGTADDSTDRKRRELNLSFFAELQLEFDRLQSLEELYEVTCQQLTDHLELSRCCFVEIDESLQSANVVFDHTDGSVPSIVGNYQLSDFHTAEQRADIERSQPVIINEVESKIDNPRRRQHFRDLQIESVCNVAFAEAGDVKYVIAAHRSTAHQWSGDEIELLQKVINLLGVRTLRWRAGIELAQSKAKMELALQFSSAASWTWDMERNDITYEPNLNRLWGFDVDTPMPVAAFVERIDDEHRERVRSAIESALVQGGPFDEEYVIHRVDGKKRWIRAVGRGLVEEGKPQEFLGVVFDVTDKKEAELQLADREAHLRRVINNQLGLVGVIDRNGNLVEVDDRSLAIARVPRQDVIGKHFAEAPWWTYDPDVSVQVRGAMERAFAGEEVRFDVSLFAAGDDGVMIDFMLAPVKNDAGEVEFLIPSGVDIRERHAASLELAESRSRLKMAMSAAKMGAFVWDRITDEVIWDEEWMNAVGIHTKVEQLGQTFFGMVHPDDIDHLHEVTQRSLEGTADYRIEFRIIRPDGQTRWLAGAGNWIDKDDDGKPRKLAGINWDITESKQYEQQIRLSEERLRVAAGAAGFAMFHVDVENNQVHWSDEFRRLVGVDANEKAVQIGELPSFIHPDDKKKVDQHLQIVLRDLEEPDHWLQHRIVKKNGDQRRVRLQTRSLYEGRGKKKRIKMIVGTLLDITGQYEFEQKLQHQKRIAEAANASKSEFVANMSHEIRTPMTAILGYAEMLQDRVADDEARGHLSTIRRNGDYLLEIINDILDLSKIEAGKLDVDQERFEPHRVIEDVRSIMAVRATEGGLRLDVEYDGKIPKVIQSDAKRLKQILINLVGNAIKFTREGRVGIRIKFDAADERLMMDVIDSGIGMTDEQLGRLFKSFSQGDASVTRSFGGTGLGLAISKRLAEMLGGQITVRSTEGVGSTFSVSIKTGKLKNIPLIRPSTEVEETSPERAATETKLDANILIVDDRRDIRFLSKHILGKAGATITEAEDGLIAIATVKQALTDGKSFDLILLDMQMPNLDGYETAKALRKLDYTGPIIALTADAMQGDMNKCLEAGCNDYLSKPIDAQRMLQLVGELTTSTPPLSGNSDARKPQARTTDQHRHRHA